LLTWPTYQLPLSRVRGSGKGWTTSLLPHPWANPGSASTGPVSPPPSGSVPAWLPPAQFLGGPGFFEPRALLGGGRAGVRVKRSLRLPPVRFVGGPGFFEPPRCWSAVGW